MMDTVLNLGLNDEAVEGLAARTGNPRFAWDSYRRLVQMFGDVVRGVPSARFEDEIARIKRERGVAPGHRARHRRPARADRALQGALRLPDRPARAARAGHPRGLRLVDGRARHRLPAHQRHPRRVGHRGQRPADGLRQQGPDLGLRRGLLARRGHRRARAQRRLPHRRPGRGRRLGRAHAARPVRAARLDAGGARPAARHHAHAGAPLRRHAGHRVHHRGGAPVHAADAQREAPRPGRDPLRGRRRRRGPAHEGAGDRDDRGALAARAAAPHLRSRRRATRSWPAASPPRRARPRAPSSSPRPTPSPRPRTGARSSSCVPSPRPTTSPASTPPRGSSPRRAARRRTRRSWPAAWAAPR